MIRKTYMTLNIIICFLAPILPRSFKFIIYGLVLALNIVAMMMMMNDGRISKKDKPVTWDIFWASMLLLVYSLANVTINGFDLPTLERILQLIMCLVVFISATGYNWNELDYFFLIGLIRIIVFSALLYWTLSGFRMSGYSAFYTNSNGFSCSLFMFLVIYTLAEREFLIIDKITVLVILFLIFTSNSRTIFAAVLIYFILRFLFKYVEPKKLRIIFILTIALIIIVPLAYLAIYKSPLRHIVNDISIRYTGKNFFSKRQIFWQQIINVTLNRPLVGFGYGVTPESMFGGNWSAHNWFIQSLLQIGFIGVTLFINLFYRIWKRFTEKDLDICRNGAAFLIGVLVWQSFEVSLTQNNVLYGIMVWLIWGICASYREGFEDGQFVNDSI